MKYVKTFDNLNENQDTINNLKKSANSSITIESILKSFFSLFTDVSAIKQIWSTKKEEKELMNISIDIYNHLIDMKNIIDLPDELLLKYANNLGIKVDSDTVLLSELSQQLYIEHYKRDFKKDLNDTIKYLENGTNFETFDDVQKLFLEKIKEIQEILVK